MAVMKEVRPAVPDVVHGRAAFAMVGVDAVHTGEEIPMDCDADSDMWDPRNEFETVVGMPVYYGGDFNDSDCEDPHDLAYEDWLDWYNLSAPEGCWVDLPDKGDDRLPNAMGSAVMIVGGVAQPAHVTCAGNGAHIAAESADPRTNFETVHGMPFYYGLNDSDCETPEDNYDTDAILTFGTGIVGFPRTTRMPSCLS